jgi:hypothetical protein
MAARQASLQSLKSIAGASLLALGLVILFANLDGVVACLNSFVGISAHETLGILPRLGLAGLHAVQAYTFNHDLFLSGLRQMLVSFWPLSLVVIGIGLLRNAFGGRHTKCTARVESPAAGAR